MKGGEALVGVLEHLGVDTIFGLCGDTSLPWYEALAASPAIRHVLTRDERSGAFMADAYARLSGRVGVCEGPSGGGATYILPGVAEANESSVPMVCLTSDIATTERGVGTLTDLDQAALFAPVTRRVFSPTTPMDLPGMTRAAFREASTGRLGACQIALPFDTQGGSVPASAVHGDACYGRYPAERVAPAPDQVRAVARELARSRRPLIVAGAGVLRSGAWTEVRELARALGAFVATSVSGKGSIAETDPLSLGVIGSNGGLPWRHDLVRKADLVFYVGCSTGSVTTEKWTLPRPGDARFVQLDVDPGVLGRSYPLAAGMRADAREGLAALTAELHVRARRHPPPRPGRDRLRPPRPPRPRGRAVRLRRATHPPRAPARRAAAAYAGARHHPRRPGDPLPVLLRLLAPPAGRPLVRQPARLRGPGVRASRRGRRALCPTRRGPRHRRHGRRQLRHLRR